jgi:transmembrane 9 superfamily protein 3
MNTVGPYHNRQETYNYFSLPFCRGTKKEISHYHETLGENILGVELEYSGIDINFKRKIFIFIFYLSTKLNIFRR